MKGALLVLNAGSSSLKFSIFEDLPGPWPPLLAHGEVARIDSHPELSLHDAAGAPITQECPVDFSRAGHAAVLGALEQVFTNVLEHHRLLAIGHRVVHGGPLRSEACRVDPALLQELRGLEPLAPLHQKHNLAPIAAWMARDPAMPQVAAFDTAFHRSVPSARRRFALPARLLGGGIERYGFHGLSYEYIAHRLRERDPAQAGGRSVVLHLGAGASTCALASGRSMATSMGFTALDGLPMATRCGSLDPGLLLHLIEELHVDPTDLREALYRESGLTALSGGLGGDMRTLLAADTPASREAVAYFCWRVAREVGAHAADLGGLDTLVFTAGIGERAPAVRAEVCRALGFLGLELDEAANQRNARQISTEASRVSCLVIPTNEEAMVARHIREVLGEAVDADA